MSTTPEPQSESRPSESRPTPLAAHTTAVPGLLLVDLTVHDDTRGWFKENWQRAKMTAIGLPDFGPIQNNVSFNAERGVTRGIHAEPWDKLVSIVHGRAFCAWVDLRDGPTFGRSVTVELTPGLAAFVPRGVGNAYQTLEPDTVYSYLVNDHWSPNASYSYLNLADETVAIPWPIPLERAIVSDKDRTAPFLPQVTPAATRKTLVLGADGQLGQALQRLWAAQSQPLSDGQQPSHAHPASATHPPHTQPHPLVEFANRHDFDLSTFDPDRIEALEASRHWADYDTIINAAAFTQVDRAETRRGRTEAWAVNTRAVAALSRIAREHRITLVQISSDYVFDGTLPVGNAYDEAFAFAPLGVYGQTKAAADAVVSTVPRHYIVRTSWVIGQGNNFVRTMAGLAEQGVNPRVVDDQFGRLTFADELARGIQQLLSSGAPYGCYNLSGSGETATWAQLARHVFTRLGHDPARITSVSTAEYGAGKNLAPRPRNSVLNLEKIVNVGFHPRDQFDSLDDYLKET